MEKEFSCGEKIIKVGRASYSGYVEADDFKATLGQLESLSTIRFQTKAQAALELNKTVDSINDSLKELKRRNRVGRHYPSTQELIAKAEEYELLDQIALLGVRTIISEQLASPRIRARERRNRVQMRLYPEE